MIEYISFGSGSCGNCSYLSNGKDAVLIDAGVGIRRLKKNIRAYGIKTNLLRAILITHDHADHIKAAAQVAAEYNIGVYATRKIHDGMRHNNHTMRKVDADRQRDVEADVPFNIGSLNITAFPLPHDSTENMGYSIATDDGVFTIMTDVGAPTDNVRKYIGMSNYLVIEANYDEQMLQMGPYPAYLKQRIVSGMGHLSNKQAAEVLADSFHDGLRAVWLCHLSEENNHPELARKTVEMVLQDRQLMKSDFMLEVLRRGLPTGPWTFKGGDYVKETDMAEGSTL